MTSMRQTIEVVITPKIMRSIRTIEQRCVWVGVSLLVLFVVLLVPGAEAEDQSTEVVIIGNSNLSENSLSKIDVQNIFLGKKTKLDATKITFVILKEGEVHELFLKEHLSRTPDQYTKYWKKLVFTGKGRAPKAFATEDDLIQYVEETEGAIGYIAISTAQSLQSSNIHQISVQ